MLYKLYQVLPVLFSVLFAKDRGACIDIYIYLYMLGPLVDLLCLAWTQANKRVRLQGLGHIQYYIMYVRAGSNTTWFEGSPTLLFFPSPKE
jgi:hypothetical protein